MNKWAVVMAVALAGCSGTAGGNGANGETGPQGPKGDKGEQGPVGPAGDAADSFTPGNRITRQKQTWTGADGFVFGAFGGLYDAGLGMPCSPLRAEDGAMRCLPAAGYVQYADAVCSVAVHVQAPCSDVPSHVSEVVSDAACASLMFRARPVSAAATTPAAVWTLSANGTCTPSAPLPSPYVYFELGAPLDPVDLVALTAETDP